MLYPWHQNKRKLETNQSSPAASDVSTSEERRPNVPQQPGIPDPCEKEITLPRLLTTFRLVGLCLDYGGPRRPQDASQTALGPTKIPPQGTRFQSGTPEFVFEPAQCLEVFQKVTSERVNSNPVRSTAEPRWMRGPGPVS